MARLFRQQIQLDTCMFSPHQLHPTAILRLVLNTGSSVLTQQLNGMRTLLKEHRTGLVAVGASISFVDSFNFFSSDFVEIETTNLYRKEGKWVEAVSVFKNENRTIIEARILFRFIRISPGEALDAEPGQLNEKLKEMLQKDEVDNSFVERTLNREVSQIRKRGERIQTGDFSLQISREDCELADQWQLTLLPSFVGRSRESLIFASGNPLLKVGLSSPLNQLKAKWSRPVYLGEEIVVTTEAYRLEESLFFIHEVRSPLPHLANKENSLRCATVIESFRRA